ncbi:hypothetical protein [Alkalicoccobacillus gibsonii]|uniref:hypothetical protein n=1 Tax=Alkalicoccobacillus gibsonii TaxID=79881 RepID=UPI003514FDA9
MVSEKTYSILLSIWLIATVYIINGSFFYALFISIVIFVARKIGKGTNLGPGKRIPERRFKLSKVFPIIVGVVIVLLWLVVEVPLWRMLLLSVLLSALALFELIDAYIWYKKDRHASGSR